ncbi:MAG: daptide-type RiPP biosynthesis aminotransferase [Acidimicrobiales bacterium]
MTTGSTIEITTTGPRTARTSGTASRAVGPPTRTRLWSYLVPPSQFSRPAETVVDAHGTRVRFADGVEAQCGRSGLWNVNFGYGHPAVADAVAEATRSVTYLPLFRSAHPWAERAAEALVDLLGPARHSHVLFSTSGSAANDAVMKMARQWAALRGEPGRDLIVGLRNSYHGQTYGSIAVSGDDLGQPMYKVDQRLIRHIPADDVTALQRLLDRQGARIAAFVIEPVLGNGTVPVDPELIRTVLAGRDDGGYLVVADEVATGFLRTGEVFATDTWPARPDATILSKGLTNGACGAAAIVLGRRLTEPFVAADSMFVHGETQGGSPPSCAAVLAVADLVGDPAVVAAARRAGDELGRGLAGLGDHPLVVGHRGRGCFRSLRLVGHDGRSIGPDDRARVIDHIRRAGAWVYPAPDGVQLIPPVVSSPSDIDSLVTAVGDGLDRFVSDRGRGAVPCCTGAPVPS